MDQGSENTGLRHGDQGDRADPVNAGDKDGASRDAGAIRQGRTLIAVGANGRIVGAIRHIGGDQQAGAVGGGGGRGAAARDGGTLLGGRGGWGVARESRFLPPFTPASSGATPAPLPESRSSAPFTARPSKEDRVPIDPDQVIGMGPLGSPVSSPPLLPGWAQPGTCRHEPTVNGLRCRKCYAVLQQDLVPSETEWQDLQVAQRLAGLLYVDVRERTAELAFLREGNCWTAWHELPLPRQEVYRRSADAVLRHLVATARKEVEACLVP